MEQIITCSVCGAEIGKVKQIADDQERLQIGNLFLNVGRGVCSHCGTEFHWSLSERMLAELIKRVLENRSSRV